MAVSLELAISAIRAGRKAEGRQLLNLLIQKNPNNAQAWLWMSSVVDSEQQRARCLYHVLSIEPESKLARRGLKILGVEVPDTHPLKIASQALPQPAQLLPPADSGKDKVATSAPKAEAQTQVRDEPQPQAKPEATEEAQSQPETSKSEARRPFLIDPQQMTEELPFTPLRAPFSPPEPIQASPAILSIDVEKSGMSNGHRPENSENGGRSRTKTEPMSEEKAAGHKAAPAGATENEASGAGDAPAQQPAAEGTVTVEEDSQSMEPVSAKEDAAPSTKVAVPDADSATATGPNPLKTQKLPSIMQMLYGPPTQTPGAQQQKPAGNQDDEAAPPAEPEPDPRTVETQKLQEEVPSIPPRTVTRPSQPVPVAASNNVVTDSQAQQQVTLDEQPQMPAQQAKPQEATPAQPAPPPPSGSDPEQPPLPGNVYHQMPPANSQGPNPNFGPAPAANGSSPNQTHQNVAPHHHQPPQQPYNDPNAPPPPPETRPAQPILVNYPPPNPNGPPPPQQTYYYGGQQSQGQPPSNETMPMPHPNQQVPPPGQPSQPAPPSGQHHAPDNVGGQPQHNDYYRPPSEPVPVVHPTHSMGLVPYGYHFQQAPPGMGLHSNATVLMPNLSEAEIRARLATSQAIPTANAAAMPLQHASGWPGAHPWYGQRPAEQEYDDDMDDESGGEVNVLAVIIFGTLSVTALGGLGMLILLILTTSPPTS